MDPRPIISSLYEVNEVDNIFRLQSKGVCVCVVLVDTYWFQAIWGLNHLDFINYNKI
jgi:hypothetical protein